MSSQVVEEQSRALQLDALRSSHPVEVPIRHATADALVGWVPMGDIWIEMAIESHGNNIELIYTYIYRERCIHVYYIYIYTITHIYIDTYRC
jgi:hypothetical protein